MVAQESQSGFIVKENEEHFHWVRRKRMLAKYGDQIKALYGPDWRSAIPILTSVLVQFAMAIYLSVYSVPIWKMCIIAYVVGGFCHQCLFFGVHELSHNLVVKWRPGNRILAFIANLPLLLPMAISFRKYHMDHHIWLGVEGKDPDLPTRLEVRLLKNRAVRAISAFFQIAFYVLRPAITMPRAPESGELWNWAVLIASDAALIYGFGWRPVLYLLLSSILGSGFHPAAGHFISEHYVLDEPEGTTPQDGASGLPQETFSYYGPLNLFLLNGGYHLEHHDHPQIACWKLPILHKIAPEFYQGLKHYESWFGVTMKYAFGPDTGAHCRVVREQPKEGKLKAPSSGAKGKDE